MHAAGKTNWRHLRKKTPLMRHACAPSRAQPPRVYSKEPEFKKEGNVKSEAVKQGGRRSFKSSDA